MTSSRWRPWFAARMIVLLAAGTSIVASGDTALRDVSADPAPIPWSAKRSLAWRDYVGKPDVSTGAAAVTVYRFSYKENCVDQVFTFTVISVFQPQLSWVRPSALTNLEGRNRLLMHEQGHFDLSEVSARRLRRVLSQIPEPCSKPADVRRDLVARHMREDTEQQARYDWDTNYGLNLGQQTRALVDIGRRLASLAEYSAEESARRPAPLLLHEPGAIRP